MTQNRSQALREGDINRTVNRNLKQARNIVLNRIFRGDDLRIDGIHLIERSVQGGCLAGARGTGHQNDTIGLADDVSPSNQRALVHSNFFKIQLHDRTVQHPHNHAFTEHRGQNTNAQIDRIATHAQLNTPVLRKTTFGNIKIGHYLHARNQSHGQVTRRGKQLIHHAISPNAHLELIFKRL